LEEVLDIDAYAMNWPMGMGKQFLGLYDFYNNRVELTHPEGNGDNDFLPLNEAGEVEGDYKFKESSIYTEALDRKSTRLNSSHVSISYAVFCLKKKKKTNNKRR